MKALLTIIAVCALSFGAELRAAAPPVVASAVSADQPTSNYQLQTLKGDADVGLVAFLYAIEATRWEEELCAVALAIAACAFLPKQYRSLGAFVRYLRWVAHQTKQEFARLKLLLRSLLALAFWRPNGYCTANVETAAGTHKVLNMRADAAHSYTHLLVKAGTDSNHAAVCGAGDKPIGITTDQPEAAEDLLNVTPLGLAETTRKVRVATAVAADVDLYTAANGFAQAEPAVAGTYYRVGRSKYLAVQAGSGDYLSEFVPCTPVKVVVIAALTATTNIGTLNSTAVNPTKADFDALLVAAEKVRQDVLAIGAALATPAEIKVLV